MAGGTLVVHFTAQISLHITTVETLYSTIYYSKYFIELNMISLHNKLPFELTKDTPYLALSGELWSVFYEYFNRNWSCYKGFLLYLHKTSLDVMLVGA